ncbi:polycystin family receptor for egg jelly-like [Erinaceus europaeus]|uniref:Polycystin family receptor for egg jelly-like n=1 Tax=Erinaceus europaeus TaxID=9365 RepID=A0ABM3XD45_ERIEU|nr:polycystin family receptor for egg jelly-like [Erinaceus europaeus]
MTQTACVSRGLIFEAVDSDHDQHKQPSALPQVNSPCVIKEVKIHTDTNQRPLRIYMGVAFTLYGRANFDCPSKTKTVLGEWYYVAVPRVGHVPQWGRPREIEFLKVPYTSKLEIHDLHSMLGVYIFNYTLSIKPNAQLPLLVKSDVLYVVAERRPLKAVLLGPQNITVKFTDLLVLNGSTSNDPDEGMAVQGLTYTWYCTTNPKNYQGDKIIMMSKEVCGPEQTSLRWGNESLSVQEIKPGTLAAGRVYYFRLVVKKDTRSAFADKMVHVLPGPAPEARLLCIENCEAVFSISDRLSLFLNCSSCTLSRDVYRWSLHARAGGEIPFDWKGLTTTGRNRNYLSVKAFALSDFPEDQYYISGHITAWAGKFRDFQHFFVINHAPRPGECKIKPRRGTSLATKFVVMCRDFKDYNTPLKYKVILSDSRDRHSLRENTMGVSPYFGTQSTSSFFLPVGLLVNRYSLKIYVQVYDSLGTFTQVTLASTVLPPTNRLSPETVLQKLHNLTMGPDSKLSDLLKKKDFLGAGYLIYIGASILNSMRYNSSMQEDMVQLREHLVNQTFQLPLNTLEEITQVVAALAKLTQRVSAITEMSQERSTERISQANQALQEYRKRNKQFHSEQIDTVCTGILRSLSNLLKLSAHHKAFEEPIYVLDSLADTVLASVVPETETKVLQSPGINMYVRKTGEWNAANVSVQGEHSHNDLYAKVNISSVPGLSENAHMSTTFIEFTEDPFPWIGYPENISTDVVGFRMSATTANGEEVEITPEVAEVYLARKTLSSEVFNITMRPSTEFDRAGESSKTATGAFRFEVDCSEQKEVLLHIITEVTLLFMVSVYAGGNLTHNALIATYLVPRDIPPMANQSDLFDPNCTVKAARVVCLSPSLLQVIAERLQSTYCVIAVVLQAPQFVLSPNDKLVRISVFRAQCLDMYGIQNEWNEHSCTLGEKTSWQRVHCVCKIKDTEQPKRPPMLSNLRQYSRYFVAKVIVFPNPVDLRLDVLKKITQNPVTLIAVIFILILYIILAFWALHRDETDQFIRQHVIILPDNDPYDKTCYLLTVFTGSRCGSGTRANVFVQLLGTQSTSNVHCLSHPHFPSLYRGSINTFLLTTRNDLGNLHYIRVWHNNEGSSPSWYLSRIKVENLFSRKIWLFMCRKWLSIDTSLYRTFYASQPDQPVSRLDFFLIDMTYKMGKSHMWFSVFAAVISKQFNRLQRLSCCLSVLLSSLLCNIMFLNLNPSEGMESPQDKYFRSMIIGMESTLITLPVQVIITALFNFSQRNPLVPVKRVAPRMIPEVVDSGDNWGTILQMWYKKETSEPEKTREVEQQRMAATSVLDTKAAVTVEEVINTNTNANPDARAKKPTSKARSGHVQTKTRFVLPHCFVYLAWVLVFATCSISSFFIVLYGLTYGYERSLKWLFSSFFAFIQSVFLVQPVKIILFTGFQTNRSRYCKNLSWISTYRYTEISLEDLNLNPSRMAIIHQNIVQLQKSRMYQPLTEDEIRIFNRKKMVKKRALLFLCYILTHFIFLALLLTLVAILRHKDTFHYNQFISDQFSVDLVTVTKLDDIYSWLDKVPLPLFHNDVKPTFLPDSSSKILGLPRMRQVRAKPGGKTCLPAKHFGKSRIAGEIHCHPQYGSDPEDTRNYSASWDTVASQAPEETDSGFTYKPTQRSWAYRSYGLSYTYGSGGYTFQFFPEEQQFNSTLRIKDLQSSHWLDEKTWAVILELTTFNADSSLFCSLSVIFEVSQVGVVNTSLSAHSFSLADFNRDTSSEIYLYVAILLFLLAYIIGEVYVISQEGALYVRSVYNLVNFVFKSLFLVLAVLFIRKHTLAMGVIQFYLSNPVAFLPFHAVSQVDQFMRMILGFLLFLAFLKTLKYSRVFYNVRLAQRAIRAALPGICHMAFVVSVYIFLYMAFGYLVFGQHEWNYSHLLHSTQTIFSYCVSAFHNTEFCNNRALGILLLSSFILLMVCILINLFKAVILSSYEEMKQPVYEEPSEEAEAMAYLYHKLRAMLTSVGFHSETREEPKFFVDMVYGQPERNSHRYLGLKTRNFHGENKVYLVV